MSITFHNFTWEGARFVQIETQMHHIEGVLFKIREGLENSDCSWEEIYSTHYKSEEDGTITFYEGESAKVGQPGIWTYVVYNCAPGKEEIVVNLDVDPSEPSLKLRHILSEIMAAVVIDDRTKQVQQLRQIAANNGLSHELLLSFKAHFQKCRAKHSFETAASYVLEKNAELYRRLA